MLHELSYKQISYKRCEPDCRGITVHCTTKRYHAFRQVSHALSSDDTISQYTLNRYLAEYVDVYALLSVKRKTTNSCKLRTVIQTRDACIYRLVEET